MKLPHAPPPEKYLWPYINATPGLLEQLDKISPTVDGKYLHWDELRHRTPPGSLKVEGWWLVVRAKRRHLAKPGSEHHESLLMGRRKVVDESDFW